MLESLFGPAGEADEQVLAQIEVSAREERQIGRRTIVQEHQRLHAEMPRHQLVIGHENLRRRTAHRP